jgi:aryl-alcohol dehydrogenase-like predicted oxidoreductase
MIYREIPNTDLRVSVISLGTMTFGRPVAEKDAVALVQTALEEGINFFDTADIYEGYDRQVGSKGGVAERILGAALHRNRERAIVTTKVGCDVGGRSGLGRAHVRRQIDASLRRLGFDYVDLYLMHRPDPDTTVEESAAVMCELVAEGKIRNWGVSNFSAQQIRAFVEAAERNNSPRPVVCQPRYSWLRREIEAEQLPLCRKLGMGVTAYQPLAGGLLTGKYRRGLRPPAESRASDSPRWLEIDEAIFTRLDEFEQEAKLAQMPAAQYAIYWLLRQPGVTSAVVGITKREQVFSAVQAASLLNDN